MTSSRCDSQRFSNCRVVWKVTSGAVTSGAEGTIGLGAPGGNPAGGAGGVPGGDPGGGVIGTDPRNACSLVICISPAPKSRPVNLEFGLVRSTTLTMILGVPVWEPLVLTM